MEAFWIAVVVIYVYGICTMGKYCTYNSDSFTKNATRCIIWPLIFTRDFFKYAYQTLFKE